MNKNSLMKKYNFLLIVIFVSVTISCEDDDKTDRALELIEQSVDLDISPKSISTFDTRQVFAIAANPEGSNSISSVDLSLENFDLNDRGARVRQQGQYTPLTTVSISNNTGEVTLSQDELLLENTSITTYIRLLDDEKNGSVAIIPMTLFNPVEASATSDKLEAQTTVNDTLIYDITTRSAIVDRVEVEQKTFFDGSYEAVPNPVGGPWSVDEGQYIFQGEDFNIMDTVYFRVTAFSGELTANVSNIKVFIDTQRIDEISNSDVVLDVDTNSFNLQTGSIVEDQEFVFDDENSTLGSSEDVAIEFVKIPNDATSDFFKGGDLIRANEIFEAGTKMSVINNFNVEDVFVYRLTREVMDKEITSTGLLRVNQISIVDSEGSRSISISNKEEVTDMD